MSLEAPSWWYRKPGIQAVLLSPVSLAWAAVARLRWMVASPYRASIPVICVGNPTSGGAGKTPVAMAVARLLQQEGERPVFLTRGYGGATYGPHLVNRQEDSAADVGDEPLLLARVAPTIVSSSKTAGARLADQSKASVIVMDDGFQNPSLEKDLSLLVVDKSLGIGNGWVIPAGPLRANMRLQLSKAHALVPVGSGHAADSVIEQAQHLGLPILEAELVPRDNTDWLKVKPVVAFSGIGHPQKFFSMLEKLGASIMHRASFPDHHAYSYQDADQLLEIAMQHGAQLVTTEKDMARLNGAGSIERLRKAARALSVRMWFKDQGKFKRLVSRAARRR